MTLVFPLAIAAIGVALFVWLVVRARPRRLETSREIREAEADWRRRLAEWNAGRAVRCQECGQIELPGEPRHYCTRPNSPIVVRPS